MKNNNNNIISDLFKAFASPSSLFGRCSSSEMNQNRKIDILVENSLTTTDGLNETCSLLGRVIICHSIFNIQVTRIGVTSTLQYQRLSTTDARSKGNVKTVINGLELLISFIITENNNIYFV